MNKRKLTNGQAMTLKVIAWLLAFLVFVVGYVISKEDAKREYQEELRVVELEAEVKQFQIDSMSVLSQAKDSLYDSLDYGMVLLSSEGAVLEWNPAMERMTGYTKGEMLGKTLRRIMSEEAYGKHSVKLAEAIKNESLMGRNIRIICEIVPRGKNPFVVQASVRLLTTVDEMGVHKVGLAIVDRHRRVIELIGPEVQQKLDAGTIQ